MTNPETQPLTQKSKKHKKKTAKNKRKSKAKSTHSEPELEFGSLSLSDGNIRACNLVAKDRCFDWEAYQMWEFGLRIGVVGKGNDKEILSKLQELVERDFPQTP